MITVLQRVQHAKVEIDGKTVGATEQGLLILLGVAEGDTRVEADKLVKKIANLRIFEDENGKMNLSLLDIGGGVLVVSQFTLYADCRKGNRPSFIGAGAPAAADRLYADLGIATSPVSDDRDWDVIYSDAMDEHYRQKGMIQ